MSCAIDEMRVRMVECSCTSQSRAPEVNTSNRMWRLAWGKGVVVVVEVEAVVVSATRVR